MPFQSIIHTAILVIFLKRINGTDWFSLLKVLLRFTIACYVYSKPSCHTHHLLWFGTYFPSISCALYPQPSCISLILRMPVHWIVARLQWETTYRLLNNSQYYWTLTILQGAKDWAESLCVFSHLIFIQPCEVKILFIYILHSVNEETDFERSANLPKVTPIARNGVVILSSQLPNWCFYRFYCCLAQCLVYNSAWLNIH